jgi:hypothetical protein
MRPMDNKNKSIAKLEPKMSQEVANYFSNYVSSKKIKNEQDRRALQLLFKSLCPVDITDAMICCNIVTLQHIINSSNKIYVSNLESESYCRESYRRVKDMGTKASSSAEVLMKLLDSRTRYLSSKNFISDSNAFIADVDIK